MTLSNINHSIPILMTNTLDVSADRPMVGLSVNVYRTARYLVVNAGLPRCRPEHIRVTLAPNQLLIEAERHPGEEDVEEEEREYFVQELPYGAIGRVIPLPNLDLALHSAEAHFANGLLIVTIPTTEWDARLRHKQGGEAQR